MIVNFALHRVHFSILVSDPASLLEDLGNSFLVGRTIPESKTNNPLMADKFWLRTYLTYGSFTDIFLLHYKKSPIAGLDALLSLVGVDLKSLQEIALALIKLSSVTKLWLSKVEFKWDFYGDKPVTDLQRAIVEHVYLKNARSAFTKGGHPRKTYYVNARKSDLQLKTYVRPKDPGNDDPEFVRVELTARRRWLANRGIETPADLLNIPFETLAGQIAWLTLRKRALRGSWLNFVTNGRWFRDVLRKFDAAGIARVITANRKSCPTRCHGRGDYDRCPLWRAILQPMASIDRLRIIRRCRRIRRTSFEPRFCFPYRRGARMRRRMKKAFTAWSSQHHVEQKPS